MEYLKQYFNITKSDDETNGKDSKTESVTNNKNNKIMDEYILLNSLKSLLDERQRRVNEEKERGR